jgi:mono/diheme cytochrome c family protein
MTGDSANGRADFGRFCAFCHGAEGVQGLPNPGSDDKSVPILNPIDPSIADPDASIFAANVDRIVEHGSVPAGPGPLLIMPPYGDLGLLTQQQIADIIAYVLEINNSKASQ